MKSLTLMGLLTSLMSIHPLSRLEGAKSRFLSTHAKLELAYSDLLGKYIDLLKKHSESIVLAKQVEESHKKLKQEHRELAHKYQELEFAYEAIDPSLENSINENIEMLLIFCPSLLPLGKRN